MAWLNQNKFKIFNLYPIELYYMEKKEFKFL